MRRLFEFSTLGNNDRIRLPNTMLIKAEEKN